MQSKQWTLWTNSWLLELIIMLCYSDNYSEKFVSQAIKMQL